MHACMHADGGNFICVGYSCYSFLFKQHTSFYVYVVV